VTLEVRDDRLHGFAMRAVDHAPDVVVGKRPEDAHGLGRAEREIEAGPAPTWRARRLEPFEL
jgi:hypothetical protein